MADRIELGATAYSLHPDQRRRRPRRGLLTPDHPFTRSDDGDATASTEAPPTGPLRRLLGWVASAWTRTRRGAPR